MRISASRHIDAAPADLYSIITDPQMHVAIDGSHMLIAAPDARRLREVGDSFTIDMDRDALGDMPLGKYTVLNTVTKIEPDALLEWSVGSAEHGPFGHVYGYELTPAGNGATDVTSYCDWSGIPAEFLEKVHFPIVPKMALITTLEKLDQLATKRRS